MQSLKKREMVPSLAQALLSSNRTEILHYEEKEYWDYKQEIHLDNPFEVARLAKDVLGFHNAKGGVIIIGVTDDFRVLGVTRSQLHDTNRLCKALRKYVGPDVALFQNSVAIPNNRFLQLIFVPKKEGAPVAAGANGPQDKHGRQEVRLNEYYIRIRDEVRVCKDPGDYERVFAGFSQAHLQAYAYEIDEPYFRLLAPHCERFIGRTRSLNELSEALNRRHPVVAVEGTGGVGKTAIVIELVRRLYEAGKYMFIVSLSAKSRVWHGHIESRRAGFSGLTEFLQEVAKVLQLAGGTETDRLKKSVIENIRGTEGLLMVDNVEEIVDREVFHFLSREVPDPVKVLVTSRIERGLAALPVAVPEMENDEARELLYYELKRVGYFGYMDEGADVDEILRATGKLPLALKWAAVLASDYKSLRAASSQLRKSDPKKGEFLNFCFASMYDELSDVARNVALLCPYLGEDWNVPTVSVALGRAETEIELANEELKERAILLPSASAREGAWRLLPLTVDFLSNKWHENAVLRRQVNERLADAIGSRGGDILINWPREKRVDVLRERAIHLMESGALERARQLVRLALTWSSSPRLLFMEGRIIYESGKRSEGLAYMRRALEGVVEPRDLSAERLYLARALLSHGGGRGESEALTLLADTIPYSASVTHDLVNSYCGLALQMREYASIAKVLSATENAVYLRWMVRNLLGALGDRMFVHLCGESVLRVLEILEKMRETEEAERDQYVRAAESIRSVVRKEGTRV